MAKLRRVSDGEGDCGGMSYAIAWNADGSFKGIVGYRPTINCSMMVGSFTARSYAEHDYWLTTVVTEILEERTNYVRFKTEKSEYEWWA